MGELEFDDTKGVHWYGLWCAVIMDEAAEEPPPQSVAGIHAVAKMSIVAIPLRCALETNKTSRATTAHHAAALPLRSTRAYWWLSWMPRASRSRRLASPGRTIPARDIGARDRAVDVDTSFYGEAT